MERTKKLFPSSDYQQHNIVLCYTTSKSSYEREMEKKTMTMFVKCSHSRISVYDFEHYFMDNPFIRLCFSRFNLADSLFERIFTLNCI